MANMMSRMSCDPLENESSSFVQELQAVLAQALESLAGKDTEGEASYLVWCSIHINKILSGYNELRRQSMIYASKLLIRPLIEAAFAVEATFKKKGFLFQKSYVEYEEEKKMLNELKKCFEKDNKPTEDIQEKLLKLDLAFDNFRQSFRISRPDDPLKLSKISVLDTAEAAELVSLYFHYRIYCQFAHGSLQATSGEMDEMTDFADNHVVGWVVLLILGRLKMSAPVDMPDLNPLREKAKSLMQRLIS